MCKKLIIYIYLGLFSLNIAVAQNTTTYQYDNHNRLSNSSTGNTIIHYSFDQLGNRIQYLVSSQDTLQPDLMVKNVDVPTTSAEQGSTNLVSLDVSNIGAANAGGSYLSVYLSDSPAGINTLLASKYISDIAEGGMESLSLNITIPQNTQIGDQYLVFFADATSLISESNEDNNKSNIPVTILESIMPDLAIQNQLANPASIPAGDNTLISADIINSGNAPANNFWVRCFLSLNTTFEDFIDSELTDAAFQVSDLNAGEILPFSQNVGIPANTVPGNYYLLFVADPEDSISELNEENNIASVLLTISNPGGSAAPLPNFIADNPLISVGTTVQFTDSSSNYPTSWQWAFPGGTPSYSTAQNPSVYYGTDGIYDVTLSSSNSFGLNTITKSEYISVAPQQFINLYSGWNIASFNIVPVSVSMDSLLNPLKVSNTLIKAIDESGGVIQNIPGVGWINTIGDMENTEGYYIKLISDEQLSIIGTREALPNEIPLQTGWNIMGYPTHTAQSAMNTLQSLITEGSLIKVIDESGGFIQFIPGAGWMNTIGNFEPGEGYYIKVSTNTELVLDEPSTKATSYQSNLFEGTYYTRKSEGNPYLPMHIVATFDENIQLMQGDELGIFINDTCYGSAYISDITAPVATFVASDDPTTAIKDGGVQGDILQFKLLHLGEEYELQIADNSMVTFESLETKLVHFTSNILGISESRGSGFKVSEVIPNPFANEARIIVITAESGALKVSLIDLRGVIVEKLFEGIVEKGRIEVLIDGKQLKPGMYFVKLEYKNYKLKREVLKKAIVY